MMCHVKSIENERATSVDSKLALTKCSSQSVRQVKFAEFVEIQWLKQRKMEGAEQALLFS